MYIDPWDMYDSWKASPYEGEDDDYYDEEDNPFYYDMIDAKLSSPREDW